MRITLITILMKRNNNKNIEPIQNVLGYTPHEGQRIIHDAINNSDDKYYVISNGRQWGKTLMCINQLLYFCLNNQHANVYYVAPTFKLSRNVFYKIYKVVADSGLIKKKDLTNLQLEFITGSVLSFHSAERPDTLRGATLTHCD